jgi:hypothetical protein
MLGAARSHSYEDFGPSPTNDAAQPVLYEAITRKDRRDRDFRDKIALLAVAVYFDSMKQSRLMRAGSTDTTKDRDTVS